jgi:hypothetical protein
LSQSKQHEDWLTKASTAGFPLCHWQRTNRSPIPAVINTTTRRTVVDEDPR